jgi:hypothetical protein
MCGCSAVSFNHNTNPQQRTIMEIHELLIDSRLKAFIELDAAPCVAKTADEVNRLADLAESADQEGDTELAEATLLYLKQKRIDLATALAIATAVSAVRTLRAAYAAA